jgi:hypothetical protein
MLFLAETPFCHFLQEMMEINSGKNTTEGFMEKKLLET